MKRGIVVLLVLVVGAVLVGGWWWTRTAPEQVTQLLVDGGLDADRAAESVALVGGQFENEEGEEVLVASGRMDGEEVRIISEFGGRIVDLYAEEGGQVEVGQVLVQLDTSLLEAQMIQALAAVAAARANLDNVRSGAHPAEVLAARAALRKAIADRDAAETIWQDTRAILADPQEIDAQIVEAQAQVAVAEAQIEQARAQLAGAEVERDQYRAQGSMEEKRLYALYNYQVEAAQAALDPARANKQGTEQLVAS